MQTVSSITMSPAEPRSDPAFWMWSKLAGVSRSLSSRIGTDDPPGMIALNVPAAQHALRVLLAVDQLAQRRVHRRFVDARALHVAADAEQLRPAVLLRARAPQTTRRRSAR